MRKEIATLGLAGLLITCPDGHTQVLAIRSKEVAEDYLASRRFVLTGATLVGATYERPVSY